MAMLTKTQPAVALAAAGESDGILMLRSARPVAAGFQNRIYAHPRDPGLLIKVPRYAAEIGDPWYKRLRSRYGGLVRMAAEHDALRARALYDLELIARVEGWVETDLGCGLAVEALRARSGELAPTVFTLARKGKLDADIRSKLDAFIARIVESALVAHDLKARNIVYAYDAASGSERLVLVDGIGGRPDFSLDCYSSNISRFNKQRRARKLYAELDALTARAPQ